MAHRLEKGEFQVMPGGKGSAKGKGTFGRIVKNAPPQKGEGTSRRKAVKAGSKKFLTSS